MGDEGYADLGDVRGELPQFGFQRVWEGQGKLQGTHGGEGATAPICQGSEGSHRNGDSNTSTGNSDEDGDDDTGPGYVDSNALPSDDDGETAPEVGFEDSDAHYTLSEEDKS